MRKRFLLGILILFVSGIISAQSSVSKLIINEIKLEKISFVKSNGSSWDKSGGADVYLKVYDYRNILIENTRSSRHEDVSRSDLPIKIIMSDCIIYQLNAPFEIIIFDADAFSDDKMYEFNIDPADIPVVEDGPQLPYVFENEEDGYRIEISYEYR
ncbi:MAG: hypothetical protein K9J12_09385 [Melioribacteraceae bacterium]|nr:hypothetical protein [Melioribacteraceae bacterium]MCF8432642.1 hypothetical protein [Melioribacteraceae bacterium]